MDDIGAVRWDVRVACAILLVTVLTGAIFFWKRQGQVTRRTEIRILMRGESEAADLFHELSKHIRLKLIPLT